MSRTRTKGSMELLKTRYSDYNPDGSYSGSTSSSTATMINGELSTIIDSKTPGFQKGRARGVIYMNPVSMFRYKRFTTNVSVSLGTNPQWGRRDFELGPWAAFYAQSMVISVPLWYSRRVTEAGLSTLVSAHSKVAAPDVQALVTVAEARETARMLRSPFSKADSLLEKMLSRKAALLKRGFTLAHAIASVWLEYRLGWKPLLFEIQQYMTSYQQHVAHYKPVRKVGRSSQIVEFKDLQSYDGGGVGLSRLVVSMDVQRYAKVSSGVLYELHDESFEAAEQRRFGLRLSDVPSALWELIPLSFVVDRFVSVGDWLQAITPKPGVRILGNWTTTVSRDSDTYLVSEMSVTVGSPLVTYAGSGGTHRQDNLSYVRIVNTALPSLPVINHRELTLVQNLDHAALILAKLVSFGK